MTPEIFVLILAFGCAKTDTTESSNGSSSDLTTIETARKEKFECKANLCEIEDGFFVTNTSYCSSNFTSSSPSSDANIPVIDTMSPFSLEILDNGNTALAGFACFWRIVAPVQKYDQRSYIVISAKTAHDEAEDEGTSSTSTLTLEFTEEDRIRDQKVFDAASIFAGNVTVKSHQTLLVLLRCQDPRAFRDFVFDFHVENGTLAKPLPVTHVTDVISFVTSPLFDGLLSQYPPLYDGTFFLNVTQLESIFLSFVFFATEYDKNEDVCEFDNLAFEDLATNTTWKKCGIQTLPPQVVFGPIRLTFYSDPLLESTGFKMMYAVLPRVLAPQKVSEGVFNCSVPHFHTFAPILRCNMQVECAGGEDEAGCSYKSEACGERGIDAGSKCYQLFQREGEQLNWNTANFQCIQNNQRLVTFGTPDQFEKFRDIMANVKNMRSVFVGAQLSDRLQSAAVVALYREVWQWVDDRSAFFINITGEVSSPTCVFYSKHTGGLQIIQCHQTVEPESEEGGFQFVCEYDKKVETSTNQTSIDLPVLDRNATSWNVSTATCSSGHVTRDFLSCDIEGGCVTDETLSMCKIPGGHNGTQTSSAVVPMFKCARSGVALSYTLVCDFVQHCMDGTDEDFCVFPSCELGTWTCRNGQCVTRKQLCDGRPDCYDGSDEVCPRKSKRSKLDITFPVTINLNGKGQYLFTAMNETDHCPETHFLCPERVCLPVYMRCNGIADCLGREDEAECQAYHCPGLFRCRGSSVCLHPSQVCDGVLHCPEQDDEMLCGLSCPDGCLCQGLTFVCYRTFNAISFPQLRLLDATGSGMTVDDVANNTFLVRLHLSRCRIDTLTVLSLPNLQHLDLSRNKLVSLDTHVFRNLLNLRVLNLSGNPLREVFRSVSTSSYKLVLDTLDLSFTDLNTYHGDAFEACKELKTLNVSWSELKTITDEGFSSTPALRTLDTRGSQLRFFPDDLLQNLNSLQLIQSDNYRMCCQALLPPSMEMKNCHSQEDYIASCTNLLQSDIYRVFVWLYAVLAVFGNAGSFVSRMRFLDDESSLTSFGVFITNLSVADFIMGLYLAIVGFADVAYSGQYVFYDEEWKSSAGCSVAGFLFVMSREVSVFFICLIALDRLLMLSVPIKSVQFGRRSAMVACALFWAVAFVLALLPLVPTQSHWELFSQTGLCVPLPFTHSERFLGHQYFFGVVIVFNFVAYIFVAGGLAVIYWSARSSALSSLSETLVQHAAIARRLTVIILTNTLVWLVTGVLGLATSTDTLNLSGEVGVYFAIFVMPVNAALNPVLYVLNVVMEKRQKQQEENVIRRLESRMNSMTDTAYTDAPNKMMAASISKEKAIAQIKMWLREKIIMKDDLSVYTKPVQKAKLDNDEDEM